MLYTWCNGKWKHILPNPCLRVVHLDLQIKAGVRQSLFYRKMVFLEASMEKWKNIHLALDRLTNSYNVRHGRNCLFVVGWSVLYSCLVLRVCVPVCFFCIYVYLCVCVLLRALMVFWVLWFPVLDMDTSLDLTLPGFMISFLLLVLELFRVRWCLQVMFCFFLFKLLFQWLFFVLWFSSSSP